MIERSRSDCRYAESSPTATLAAQARRAEVFLKRISNEKPLKLQAETQGQKKKSLTLRVGDQG
jgi:hypothetical protein